MKNTPIKKLTVAVGLWLINITPVWAADVGREDNSNLFVWIFLGFCALIVVAQLIPAIMVLFGFVRGIKKEKAEPATETIDTT
jgi:hypothetical protein